MSYRIYQRGASWWMDVHAGGERVRRSCRTSARAEAERMAQQEEHRLHAGLETLTLEDAVQQCTRVRWLGTAGESTAVHNARTAVKYFGAETLLSDLTTARLDEWVEYLLRQGDSGATVNRRLAALSAVLRVAHQRGQIAHLPHIPRQREASGRIRWLSEAEERQLLGLMDGEALRLTVTLLDTGMRMGEALRFTLRDLSHNERVVHIWQTKTDRPRSIPLTTRALSALVEGPFNLTKSSYRHTWDRARGMMGLHDDTQFVPHVLRHTCASRLVQRGVPLATVQAWLGHSSVTTTMRYAHIAPSNLEAARAALEAE